ncbi:MAG: galactose mutarotase [Lachnospiraceae bacterium]|nr:galactose mutarotase [Lachnospiraceae bacterium]
MIEVKSFGITRNGDETQLYTYTDNSGVKFSVTNYGASLVSLIVPDRTGKLLDVVLGYDGVEGYERQFQCVGSVIGRCANRIERGRFNIDGEKYKVTKNFGPHHIHGGYKGFHRNIWTFKELDNGMEFSYISQDGEEGYPGMLNISIKYIIENGNTLVLEYDGISDKDTICNITSHAYFNLNGYNSGNVYSHFMQINSDEYAEANKYAFPNGKLVAVAGTPMDFRTPKMIGTDIDSSFKQIKWNNGYDTNYAIKEYDGSDIPQFCACTYSENSGIKMTTKTTMPGVQFYTGNCLTGAYVGKNGHIMKNHDGFCLETQYYPNAMAHDNFIKPILRAGERYHHITRYEFSTI